MPVAPSPRRRTVRPLATAAVVVTVVAIALCAALVALRGGEPASVPAADGVSCTAPPLPPTSFPTFTTAPDVSVARGSSWTADVRTTCGGLTLRLDGRRAPRSVASFVTLARAGYWTDSVCHRLTTAPAPTAFLQCGDPSGRSRAEPGYDLTLENVPADRTYRVGEVGLARGDGFPGTAGEFFVVHRDFTVPAGAPVYSLIGRVVSGQEVVQHIVRLGGEDFRSDGPPFASISVLGVEVHPG
jgi:peptidyl-prolyl cis-trans isomerase B (cyclophilin B)